MSVEALLGLPRKPAQQYPRPVVGTVHSTTGGVFVDVDGITHGPCKVSLPAGDPQPQPPAGTACLVYFADAGIADPWVIAFSGWPA